MVCLFCVLLSKPYVEMGVNDDWAYIRGAQTLAKTGHVVYHAYETASLGWQLYVGAAFIKLFGFSFSTTRCSLLPIALLTIVVLHRLLLRSGVRAGYAFTGSLTLATSPLFVPLSFSFMSDIPGLFTLLLCAYLCLRTLQAQENRSAILWLITACLSNVALGTVRQIAWLGVIAMVPACVWLNRHRKHFVLIGAGIWSLGLLLVRLALHWFDSQPYSLPERLIPGPFPPDTIHTLLVTAVQVALTLTMLLFPVLVGFLPAVGVLKGKAPVAVGGVALFVAFLLRQHLAHRLSLYIVPMISNYVMDEGTMLFVPGALGVRGVILSTPLRIAMTLTFTATAILALVIVVNRKKSEGLRAAKITLKVPILATFWLPFTGAYALLLIPRTIFFALWDRYLLPLCVVALIFGLRALQRNIANQRVYRTSLMFQALALTVFAAYSTATTHDALLQTEPVYTLFNCLERAVSPQVP